MKRVLIVLGGLFLLLLAAIIIVPMMVPKETYIAELTKQVEAQTGRRFEINGDVSLSLFPEASLAVEDVVLGNAPGSRQKDMAKLERLVLDLQLMPLFSGNIIVDRFNLIRPEILLEIDKKGKPNWEFTAPDSSEAAPPSESTETAPSAPSAAEATAENQDAKSDAQEFTISLGEITLSDAKIVYHDMRSGQKEMVSDLDLDLSLPDLDSPVALKGGLTWKGERLSLSLQSDAVSKAMGGGTIKAKLALSSNPVTLSYDGVVGPANAAGTLDVTVPNLRALAKWVGNPLPKEAGGQGLNNFALKGNFDYKGTTLSLQKAQITLDDIQAQGGVAVSLGSKISIKGNLDVDTLNVNPYLSASSTSAQPASTPQNAPSSSGTSPSTATAPQQPAQATPWSSDPIDVSALRTLNADLSLSAQKILLQDLEIGRSSLGILLKNGVLTANLKELNLYEGIAKGAVTLNGAKKPLRLKANFDLDGLVARPFLKAVANFDRLEGNAKANFALSSVGQSEKQLVSNLSGQGKIGFFDGAVLGIDLANMAKNIRSAFEGRAVEQAKTDFAELTGSFIIQKGILKNDDLRMLAPLMRLTGAGTADLPQKQANYRLEPKAVASLEGQGAQGDEVGLLVPIIVSGPWHNLSYRPDLAALMKQEVIGKGLKALGDGKLGEQIQKTLGKEGLGKELFKEGQKPEDVLKGFLGGLGQKPKAEPAQPQSETKPEVENTPPPAETPTAPPQPQLQQIQPDQLLKGVFGN